MLREIGCDMMYAITICVNCGRNRVADLDASSTRCPYCNVKANTKSLRILGKFGTAKEARESLCGAFFDGTGQGAKPEREDKDPMSTLEYAYEKAKGADRYVLLCEGLTRIKGTFTLEDVKAFEPKNAERIVELMMDALAITEERPGRYRAL